MGKIVDGVELLRMIRDGEIKNKQTFENINEDLLLTYENGVLYYYNERTECDCELFRDYSLNSVLKCKFEILSEEDEEDEEIDIQAIKKMNLFSVSNWEKLDDIKLFLDNNFKQTTDKYNELLKAVKKLDRTMKGIK